MIIVLGHLVVDAPSREAMVEESAEAVRQARATPGCLDFAVSADTVDPTHVNIAERWSDRAALDRFRGEGPSGGLAESIRSFSVEEFEVPDQSGS